MRKLNLNDLELTLINNGLTLYIESLEKKNNELNECSSHFFVNEGLMNEVRREKEKIHKELQVLNELISKVNLEDANE